MCGTVPGVRLFGVAAWPAVGAFRQVCVLSAASVGGSRRGQRGAWLASCGVWGDRAQWLVLEVGISPPVLVRAPPCPDIRGALGSGVTGVVTPQLTYKAPRPQLKPACCPRLTCQHGLAADIAVPYKGESEVSAGMAHRKALIWVPEQGQGGEIPTSNTNHCARSQTPHEANSGTSLATSRTPNTCCLKTRNLPECANRGKPRANSRTPGAVPHPNSLARPAAADPAPTPPRSPVCRSGLAPARPAPYRWQQTEPPWRGARPSWAPGASPSSCCLSSSCQ